jgi:hypothetical protein
MAGTPTHVIVCARQGNTRTDMRWLSQNRYELNGRVFAGIARNASAVLALSFAAMTGAAEFDGASRLVCAAERGHDCLPKGDQCMPLKPETKIAPVFEIDFSNGTIRSPYRRSLLHVSQMSTNEESFVLQGADLLFAWSALINRTTGSLTVSVADREGAYIVFGQCKPVKRK